MQSSGMIQMTFGEYVERATDELHLGPDWSMFMTLCDIVNSNPNCTEECIKYVRKRIFKSKKPNIQYLAINLLETLVKNCYSTHEIVASREVIQELFKFAQKKKLDLKVKDKLLDMIQNFALSFRGRPEHSAFEALYINLKRQGIDFPLAESSENTTFTPPSSQDSKKIQGSTLVHKKQSNSQPSNRRFDSFGRLIQEENERKSRQQESNETYSSSSLSDLLKNSKSSVNVLIEMLNAFDPNTENIKKNEIIQDLVRSCHLNQKKFQSEMESGGVPDSMIGKILEHNDEILNVLSLYSKVERGEKDILTQQMKNISIDTSKKSDPLDDEFTAIAQRNLKQETTANEEPLIPGVRRNSVVFVAPSSSYNPFDDGSFDFTPNQTQSQTSTNFNPVTFYLFFMFP